MPPMAISTSALSVAANSKSADQFTGTDLEYTPSVGVLSLFCKASATGLNVSIAAGGQRLIDDQPIPYTGTAGTLSTNDNLVIQSGVAGGVKLTMTFRNTTGGALTVDFLAKFE